MIRTASGLALLCLPLAACDRPPPDARGLQRDEVLVQISATGRADTGFSGGADIACVSGHSDLMWGLSRIAYLSSKTNTPAKLVA